MQLECQNCGAPIPAEKINIHELIAACPACNAVFGFDKAMLKNKRKHAPAPDAYTVTQTEDRTEIRYRWQDVDSARLGVIGLGVGWAIWSAFLIVWLIAMANSSGAAGGLLLLLGIGLAFMLYGTVAQLRNETRITVDADRLDVYHGPWWMPPMRNYDIDMADVERVYTAPYADTDPTSDHRVLRAELRNGTTPGLVYLPSPLEAQYLIQTVNAYLQSLEDDDPFADETDDADIYMLGDDGELVLRGGE